MAEPLAPPQLFSTSDANGVFRPVTIAAPCATLQQVLQAQPELEFTSVLTPLLTDSQGVQRRQQTAATLPQPARVPESSGPAEPARSWEGAAEALMQTSTPSFSRVLVMVVFALSCFGLLLFLWLSFGGPIPLKPKGYRVQVGFPEATQLGLEADVRVAGVSVGKLRKKKLDPGLDNRTLATLEIERKFAPLKADTKAILRQKSLLGETYVELTPGLVGARRSPRAGACPTASVQPTVELDEIFRALDPHDARRRSARWQQDLAEGINGRGRDFNDALGTLPGFAHDGADVLEVLDAQEGAVTAARQEHRASRSAR